MSTSDPKLPHEPIQHISEPLARFIHIETSTACLLLLFTIIALGLANSPWSHQFLSLWEISIGIHLNGFDLSRSIHAWINDGLMTIFFFFISLELKRELVFGELHNPKVAALPVIAALGGMFGPAVFYLLLQLGLPGQSGWGTVMATDTAFVMGCMAIFGKQIPQSLRIFMLSLAIVDDIGAILVVAIGYSKGVAWLPLVISIVGFFITHLMKKLGIRNLVAYVIIGALIWLSIDKSGIHPTVTGVILGLMTPTNTWINDEKLNEILEKIIAYPAGEHWSGDTEDRKDLIMAEVATREALSPVERLEIALHPWIGFVILPLFALANAGIPISNYDLINRVTVSVFLSFVLGKPLGVLGFSLVGTFFNVAQKPENLSWGLLVCGSILSGIGFTMALFIAALSFDASLLNSARLGILSASIFCSITGCAGIYVYKKFS